MSRPQVLSAAKGVWLFNSHMRIASTSLLWKQVQYIHDWRWCSFLSIPARACSSDSAHSAGMLLAHAAGAVRSGHGYATAPDHRLLLLRPEKLAEPEVRQANNGKVCEVHVSALASWLPPENHWDVGTSQAFDLWLVKRWQCEALTDPANPR